MPLDLQLLPDKPETIAKISQVKTQRFGLNLNSLPDKPKTNWIKEGIKGTIADITAIPYRAIGVRAPTEGAFFKKVPSISEWLNEPVGTKQVTLPSRLVGPEFKIPGLLEAKMRKPVTYQTKNIPISRAEVFTEAGINIATLTLIGKIGYDELKNIIQSPQVQLGLNKLVTEGRGIAWRAQKLAGMKPPASLIPVAESKIAEGIKTGRISYRDAIRLSPSFKAQEIAKRSIGEPKAIAKYKAIEKGVLPITPEIKPTVPTLITPKVTIPPITPTIPPVVPTVQPPITPTGEGKNIAHYQQWIKEAEATLSNLEKQLVTTPKEGKKYIKERIDYEMKSIQYAKNELIKLSIPTVAKPEVTVPTIPIDKFNAEIIASAKKIMRPGESLGENVARTKDWISSVLTNDETSTDTELVDHFQKEGNFSKDIAEYIVSKRKQVGKLPFGVKKEMVEKPEVTAPIPKVKTNDYVQFKTEGGIIKYGDVKIIEKTIYIIPDGATSPIPLGKGEILKIEQRDGRKFEQPTPIEKLQARTAEIQAKAPPIKPSLISPKVIPAKKTLQVLPQKEQLLTQIQEAITKAPTMDEEFTTHKQKLGVEGNTEEEKNQILSAIPRVSFQIDGGTNIINTKESLTKFYDAIKKTPTIMTTGIKSKTISVKPEGIITFEKQLKEAIQKGTSKEIKIAEYNLEQAKKTFGAKIPSYPSGVAGFPEYMEQFVPKEHTSKVEMPELVKLAKELLGNVPIVTHLKRNLGLFIGKLPPKIKLRPDIFKNPFLAGQVLAHEIGHLIAWLPEHLLARGGLLNRLLTVRNFIKEEFGSLKELAFARKERTAEVGATSKEIKEELQKATLYWHPFEPIPSAYTNLRFSSKELYADALSMLLIQPEKLEELAPKFYSAFWKFIDRKPEVKQALLELQDFLALGEGEKLRIRSQDIRNMFKKGEELFYEKRTQYQAQQKSLLFKLKTELIDKNTAILNKLKEAEKQGEKINPEDNPKYYLEEWNYIGGKVKNLLDKINSQVINPSTTQGITQDDLGEYLFLNRVVTERKDIANPLGQNRETAQKQLDYLLETLGQAKFDILKTSVDKFQGILKNLLDEANKAGFYKEETFAELITNPAYATFQVLDYLDDYVTPAVIHQIGTLKGIANPFVSTTLKMISTLRAVERVKTNNSIINFMQNSFPAEIQPAKIRRFGKYKAEAVEKEGFGLIKTREAGKLRAYYVDPYIADSVNYQPAARSNAVLSVFKFLNRSYFRPVYVNLNLGFQTFNLMRDFVRAWKLNPDVNFPQMLKKYTEAIPIAKRRIWGNFTDPVITEMQQSAMLSFTYNNLMRGVEDEETQMEFLLRQYDILKKNPQNPVMKILNVIEELGDFIETLPKVTGYLSRVKSGRNIKEIAHEVRVFSGSPDFLRKGAGYDWYNNVFLFSNAFKEGFRGDYEGAFANPRTRSGYWWRTAKLNLLPKILMFLATLGFFGQRIKENFDKQTEFDKTNYTTIPLGETEDGKAIYLRIPNDEVGRLFSGILWKVMNIKKASLLRDIQQIASLTAGQLPSISPEIDIITATTQYAVGQNPYDFFRGRTILTQDEMKAGGWYSLKPMLRWFGGKAGVYGLTVRAKREDQTPFEKFIQWTPIIQRYIRITAYGEEEKLREEKLERERFKAIRRLERVR